MHSARRGGREEEMWYVIVISLLWGPYAVSVEKNRMDCEIRMEQLQWMMPTRALQCVNKEELERIMVAR